MNFNTESFDINSPFFSLAGYETKGRIVNVIDGDSLIVILPLFDRYYKFRVRLKGIDTCETDSKNLELKEKALFSKYRIIELLTKDYKKIQDIIGITNKQILDIFINFKCIVKVNCFEFDKYGRLLVDIYIYDNYKSLSEILISEKLAYYYDGKTKLSEEEQLKIMF